MGKFISAAHTSDFLITQITWLYMIVSPWWESAPPSVVMALSWETEGWAAPSRLREGSCSKLWGIQVSWDLTHKWWEGAASAVIYVLHQTFTVEWAEHQSKAVDVLVHLYSHPQGQEICEYYMDLQRIKFHTLNMHKFLPCAQRKKAFRHSWCALRQLLFRTVGLHR